MIELNRNLENVARMICGRLDTLDQLLNEGEDVEIESINISNEADLPPIIALSQGFDAAAEACGATVNTDENGVKFFVTTDQQVIFLDGSNKC